ncbi:MAG: AI-2E family transporter [Chloroflexota bacterium]
MEETSTFSGRTKLVVLLLMVAVAIIVLVRIHSIVFPFLWAFVTAYLVLPIVNYLSQKGGLPRLAAVLLIYAGASLALLAASRYLFPLITSEVTIFVEDIPRLEVSLINLVGPRPLGIDIASLLSQLLHAASGVTSNSRTAGHLLVNVAEGLVKVFLYLVATFYLLMDGPRLGQAVRRMIPPEHRTEIVALGRQINLTWQQYIRGEMVLFLIMAIATSVGLTILGVPGAIFLGLASGALELLPLIGPYVAAALAVSVAYVNGTNPFGWGQVLYAIVVAAMYLVFRQAEDYFVVPHVLGRAVRLHPLVVLFSVTAGGLVAGLFGLAVGVPVAASIKAVLSYLYAKLRDQPVEFAPVQTIGGGIIEIPVHADESSVKKGTGAP